MFDTMTERTMRETGFDRLQARNHLRLMRNPPPFPFADGRIHALDRMERDISGEPR
jgi:hypothetical protein